MRAYALTGASCFVFLPIYSHNHAFVCNLSLYIQRKNVQTNYLTKNLLLYAYLLHKEDKCYAIKSIMPKTILLIRGKVVMKTVQVGY